MTFGSEVLLLMGAGFVALGPRHMQSAIGQVGRTKAQFHQASRSLLLEVGSGLEEGPGPNERVLENEDVDRSALVLPDELIEKIANYQSSQR